MSFLLLIIFFADERIYVEVLHRRQAIINQSNEYRLLIEKNIH